MALKESNKTRSKQKENLVKQENLIKEDSNLITNKHLLVGIVIGVIIFLLLF